MFIMTVLTRFNRKRQRTHAATTHANIFFFSTLPILSYYTEIHWYVLGEYIECRQSSRHASGMDFVGEKIWLSLMRPKLWPIWFGSLSKAQNNCIMAILQFSWDISTSHRNVNSVGWLEYTIHLFIKCVSKSWGKWIIDRFAKAIETMELKLDIFSMLWNQSHKFVFNLFE